MSHAIASPPLGRFLWKEYRMVRGLWLAVLVLGLLSDWLLGVLLGPPADLPTVRLFTAFGWATLYTAGAAAVLFSVEHEEQTYDFLRGLPATWGPLFAGKLIVATVSAVALGAVMAILGMLPGGFRPPSAVNMREAGSVLGVAIFEALAWGTLCSLIFKRPLAAALTTIIVGPLVVSWAVSAISSSSVPLNDPASFAAAIPLRLAIVVALFVLSLIVARRWLVTKTATASTSSVGSLGAFAAMRSRIDAVKSRAASRVDRSRPRAMIVRLLWQSWRESWKFLVVPVALAAICISIGLCGGHLRNVDLRHPVVFVFLGFFLFCCLPASPALLGALAFSADERRRGVRFLAEHAAAPRIVWLSRHMVWLGSLIALMAATAIAIALFLATAAGRHFEELLPNAESYGSASVFVRDVHQSVASGLHVGWLIVVFSLCGALAAYAIGQFCSMLLRSEILSAFTSLVLAVVLIAWIAALIAWGLSGWMFLLPLAIAFLLATWLRAPNWIAGRNSWRTWAWPAVVIVGSLAIVGIMLPQVRLNQVRNVPSPLRATNVTRTTATESALFVNKQYDKEAAATAEMYLKAASQLTAPITNDPLEQWYKPEFSGGDLPGSIDETKIPADQFDEFLTAKQRLLDLQSKQREAALKLAIEASQRPTCQFEFPLSPTKGDVRYNSVTARLEPSRSYRDVSELLTQLISDATGDSAIDQLLAALRMNRHMAMNQPTAIAVRQLRRERSILTTIAKTMTEKERSNAERRAAIERLQEFYRRNTTLDQVLLADRLVIRSVVEGSEPPLSLAWKPRGTDYLAFAANELPWERVRALIALDLITDQNLQNASRLMNSLARSTGPGWGPNELRQWYRPIYQPAMWLMQQPQAATSYFVRLEYQLRVPVNELFLEYCHTVTVERATLLQIALAMYRADHQEYPPTLDALAPEYLETLPLDPYSMGNFEYRPQGLEKPLEGYGFNTGETIPPHTPLLWSVGPDNFQLQERLIATEASDDNTDAGRGMTDDQPAKAQRREAETMYTLARADWNANYSNDNPREFLFILPK